MSEWMQYTPYDEEAQVYDTPDYLAPPVREEETAPKARGRGTRILTMILALALAAAIIAGMAYTVLRNARNTPVPVSGNGTGNIAGGQTGTEVVPDTPAGNDVIIEDGTPNTKMDLDVSTDTTVIVTDVTEIVKEVMPCIVSVENSYTERTRTIYGVEEEEALGLGSGIIIGKSSTELVIVTNNHVVAGSNDLWVCFYGDTYARAEIRGTNPSMDLAVIVVKTGGLDETTKNTIGVAKLGDSDLLQLGEPVIAIGNALGIGQSVTTGVVSVAAREIHSTDYDGTFIQTDAALNPGNSGGALINSKGEVIGINTWKNFYTANGELIDGVSYAIPITRARETIEKLMNLGIHEYVPEDRRGYFGISVTDSDDVEGAYITAVQKDGAADKAGLTVGDVIVALEDIEVRSGDDLVAALNFYAAGETVEITIKRKSTGGYVDMNLTVTLQSYDDTNLD